MQRIAILGSTGSIGENTLKVVARYPKYFKVAALTAYTNVARLAQQVKAFKPKYVGVGDECIDQFHRLGFKGVSVLSIADCDRLVSQPDIDTVVIAQRGSSALLPFLAAVRAGKRVAPANKEALVIAGQLIMQEAKKYQATVIPVDSEQSAIFQCIDGQAAPIKRIHLTASGGALLNVPQTRFERMTVKDILSHPRWKMGPKITVDSATLMNKGFEVIEAQRLFGLGINQVNVVVHPEAIIHSMVEFDDGSWLGQLGVTDMRLPIQYALTYPKRLPTHLSTLDLVKLGQLTFRAPDLKRFPSLALAFEAAKKEGTAPAVLNAANEEAVDAFLQGRLSFTGIYKIVEKITTKHHVIKKPSLTAIMAADQQARHAARQLIG